MIDLDLVQNKLNEAHQRMLDEAFLGGRTGLSYPESNG